jgi:hypothetical protein
MKDKKPDPIKKIVTKHQGKQAKSIETSLKENYNKEGH